MLALSHLFGKSDEIHAQMKELFSYWEGTIMFNKKLAVFAAVVGAIANASVVMAEGPEIKVPVLTLDTTATTPAETAPTSTTLAPLMMGLDKLGAAKPLDSLNLNIYGYVEGGYFYDATSPKRGRGPTFIGFNSFQNTAILDKL